MSDLEVNATLFGHAFSAEAGEESKGSDRSKVGGISFIEPILLKDKTQVFRATCLFRVSAMASSEKQEADTKKAGELNGEGCTQADIMRVIAGEKVGETA
jgi:hypothetical protein